MYYTPRVIASLSSLAHSDVPKASFSYIINNETPCHLSAAMAHHVLHTHCPSVRSSHACYISRR